MAALNINPTVFETEGGRKYLGSVYNLLQNIEPLYLKYRETQQMQCYVKHSETESGTYFRFGAYQLVVDYVPVVTGKPVTAGVIFELDQDRFLVAGMMSRLTFLPKTGGNRKAGIVTLQEGCVVRGEWVPARTLNGDEQMMLAFGDEPACLYVELYQY